MTAAQPVRAGAAPAPRAVTLLQLVRAIGEITEDDREVVATVLHLLRSGRVQLRGNFCGSPPDALA
ncbi:MAG: hypothetical protein OEM49_05500 [Myxococcales bacterium]|nr:hypothetical protein [Myxococcales bacterium]MDH5306716.1 hypothetical protein [Myxococcales bacterium]MDH5565601.1 hypothetical protein [Myxococcales bacterium]